MSTKLTAQIVEDAISVIDNYIGEANDIYSKLSSEVSTLTSDGFQGDAAQGYLEFYNNTMTPMLTTNLTSEESVTASLKKLLTDIKETLLDNVDPQLGSANRNAGQSDGTTNG